MKNNVLYLHGRPSSHPLHFRFAKSISEDATYVDFRLRWQDKEKSIYYRILSWLICAASYPKKKYKYFLIDGLHFPPVIMKLFFLRKDQKIIAHLGSHTLYFLFSDQFSPMNKKIHLWALKQYDALICEGNMAFELVNLLLEKESPPKYVSFLGPPRERYPKLKAIRPAIGSNKILLIANGPTEFRKFYKGLDIMLRAFDLSFQKNNNLIFYIVGDWTDRQVINSVLRNLSEESRKSIHFLGKIDEIEMILSKVELYLHCSRGDAFPTSTLEAMAAGVVPIVSNWTGTKEVVEVVDKRLIVNLDVTEISNKIMWFIDLPQPKKIDLSHRCRAVVDNYTEEKAIFRYKEIFMQIQQDFS